MEMKMKSEATMTGEGLQLFNQAGGGPLRPGRAAGGSPSLCLFVAIFRPGGDRPAQVVLETRDPGLGARLYLTMLA